MHNVNVILAFHWIGGDARKSQKKAVESDGKVCTPLDIGTKVARRVGRRRVQDG